MYRLATLQCQTDDIMVAIADFTKHTPFPGGREAGGVECNLYVDCWLRIAPVSTDFHELCSQYDWLIVLIISSRVSAPRVNWWRDEMNNIVAFCSMLFFRSSSSTIVKCSWWYVQFRSISNTALCCCSEEEQYRARLLWYESVSYTVDFAQCIYEIIIIYCLVTVYTWFVYNWLSFNRPIFGVNAS